MSFGEVILKMLMLILILLLVVMIAFCGYFVVITIRNATLEYEQIPATAIVNRLDYRDGYYTTTYTYIDDMMIPQQQYHDPEYNIYILYKGNEYCINNKKMYNSLNVGNEVDIIFYEGGFYGTI